ASPGGEAIFRPPRRAPLVDRVPLPILDSGYPLGPLPAARSSGGGPMPPSYPTAADKPTWDLLARCFAFRPGARFTGLLDPTFFQRLAQRPGVGLGEGPDDTFNAPLTVWAWISQVLSPAKSCLAAVARVLVLCCSLSRPIPSAGTGAYCK